MLELGILAATALVEAMIFWMGLKFGIISANKKTTRSYKNRVKRLK